MKVCVTGGSGFIGSHVLDKLAAAGHDAVNLDLRPSPYGHPTVVVDLCDRLAVREALANCEAIVHLAAIADVDWVAKDPELTDQVNVRGTQSLLDAARELGVRRFVYASTIWVYGDASDPEAVDEETPLGLPKHFYTATKIAGEMYCASYGELYGLEHTILRFGIPYGPRSRPTAVVAAFTAKALRGEPLTIAGDGTQSRRFVYVEDLAAAHVLALKPAAKDRTFNLESNEAISIRTLAETVRDVVGDVEVTFGPSRPGDYRARVVSSDRAREELGWEPKHTFAQGLEKTLAWYREQLETP